MELALRFRGTLAAGVLTDWPCCADGENRTPNRGESRLPPRDSCGFHHRKLRQLPPSFRRVRLSPWLWKGFDFWMVLLYLFICCCGAGRSRTALIPFAPVRTPVLSQAPAPWELYLLILLHENSVICLLPDTRSSAATGTFTSYGNLSHAFFAIIRKFTMKKLSAVVVEATGATPQPSQVFHVTERIGTFAWTDIIVSGISSLSASVSAGITRPATGVD